VTFDQPPTLIGDRYEVVEQVGAGSSGDVYFVRDRITSQECALKLIFGGMPPEAEERFLREARVLGQIQHPNVIQVWDVGRHGRRVWLVMEYARYGTLRDWLRDKNPLDDRRRRFAFEVTRQVLTGLDHAHSRGLIHRDIKPENVFFTEPDRFKIGDFGVARQGDDLGLDLTRSGERLGTIGYMAPEQMADARAVTARTDLYAVGTMLYELLGGWTRPLLMLFRNELPVAENPHISPPMLDVIRRATRFDPAERPASAGAMIEALERAWNA
jgi:serine/threonine protein kinase